MLIDYEALEAAITDKTKAVIPVSLFGNPLDWDRLNDIKARRNLYMIEDAACSLGAEYKGIKVGNLSDISVFSHHPRKFITTGEGGTITTNNDGWNEWLESYKHFGMGASPTREGTVFARIGTNYKLSNLLAAVGLAQMNHIDNLLARRIALAENYVTLLHNLPGVEIPQITPKGKHSYQSFCIFVKDRDRVMQAMRAVEIEVQIGTYALHMHPAFAEGAQVIHRGPFTGSRYAYDHCLALPLYHELTHEDQGMVIHQLLRAIEAE
jgi:dTDP-4-amino-4,6-dideoxygalactose transaminase